jgi:glycosyltransferase involved in cell wall biosynthesis
VPNAAPPPDDIVIFFGPGAASQADAICTLALGEVPLCKVTLRHGAGTIDIAAGGDQASLTTAARSSGRPVVVTISTRDGSTCCRVGHRPSVALPGLAAAFGFDTIAAPSGTMIDRISPLPSADAVLPRGLAPATSRAGAVDHVSRSGGITGWVVDRDRSHAPHEVELRCGDLVLASTLADRARPATAAYVDQAPLGRFSIPWADIDRCRLERCATITPHAAIAVAVPALGAWLDHAYRPISARTALALAGPVLHLDTGPGAQRVTLTPAHISAVIPNYNYAQYLPQRIGSLLAQDAAPEIILLDDASTDDSLAVALDTARAAGREIQIVTSPRNSGSVLPQWRRAATLARGDYLLIAEADDVAEPALVSILAAQLDAHPDMVFAFSDSMQIDAAGAITRPDFKAYYAALGDRALDRAQVLAADTFLLRFLMPRNLVVNVSAVLWRTAALRAAFERLGDEIERFRAAGDWRVYIEACLAGGSVGYVPTPLNRFRRHETSVIGRYSREQHIAEIEAIHALLLSLCAGDESVGERLADQRAALRRLWALPPVMDGTRDSP